MEADELAMKIFSRDRHKTDQKNKERMDELEIKHAEEKEEEQEFEMFKKKYQPNPFKSINLGA